MPAIVSQPAVGRYDHTRGLDWPAMRGTMINASPWPPVFISDLGQVEVGETRLSLPEFRVWLAACEQVASEVAAKVGDGSCHCGSPALHDGECRR